MPEGPELEQMRRGLLPLVGHRISVEVLIERKKTPTVTAVAGLQRVHLRALERHGKRLAFRTRSAMLTFGAGMSGYWHWGAPRKHDIIAIHSRAGSARYNDARRFGFLRIHPPDYPWHADLGPDGLDAAAMHGPAAITALAAGFARYPNRPIKPALLDQGLIAGLGNIYAAEVLFRLRVHPARRLSDFTRWRQLGTTTHRVLSAAVAGGGTRIIGVANEYQAPGHNQVNGLALRVYGRTGLPCVNCRRPIEQFTQAGRTTFYCVHCQEN